MAAHDPDRPRDGAADAPDTPDAEYQLARDLARLRGESLEVLISELSAGSAGDRRA
jgi:hypothetical protein